MDNSDCERRYFVTYRGVKLPSTMVSEIDAASLTNRNTHICAYYDGAGRLRCFEKWVYGEIELIHRYDYDEAGTLTRAEIEVADEDVVVLHFKGAEAPIASR